MKKIGVLIITLTLNSLVFAGFNGFTVHSRANCANNESISWDWTHEWRLVTYSEHYYKGKLVHTLIDPDRWTRRSAAVHWGESFDLINKPYVVIGTHWRHYTDNTFHIEGRESVNDCSLYDGWWDV